MKVVAVVLLAVIAAGVAYLAYSQYQARQVTSEALDQIRDPAAYIARTWAEQAGLDCDLILEVESQPTPSGVLRPMRFQCFADNGTWTIEDVACPEPEPTAARGLPREGGFYKPLSVICWIARLAQ